MVIEQREESEPKAEKLLVKRSGFTPVAGLSFAKHSQPPRGESQVVDLFEIIRPEKDFRASRPAIYFWMALMWALFLLTLYLIWQKAAT